MKLLSGWAWLAARASRAKSKKEDMDPADMGTAFGLDASFGPIDSQSPEPSENPDRSDRRLVRRPQR